MNQIIPIRCKGNRYLPYSELKEFQGGLKKISKDSLLKLRALILKHGWIAPIFVWNEKEILDGHGRLLALKGLLQGGYEIGDLPIVDIDAGSRKEAAEILLSINSHFQSITEAGLKEYMQSFEYVLPDINLNSFEVLFSENKKGNIEDDDVPEVKEFCCKAGDLWFLGRHRLLCGDATKKEDIERLMDGKKADMVFTDPPYGVGYADKNKFLNTISRGNRIQKEIRNDHARPKDMQKFWTKVFSFLRQVIKKGAAYYVTGPQGGDLLLLLLSLNKSGFTLKHMLIWSKNNHVLGRCDYHYKHEPIIYGWVDGPHKFYGSSSEVSVWEIDKPLKSDLHPTMKPVELIERAIKNSSKVDSIIVDLFLGSGSTLIACEKTGRICYGMEIESYYCDVILARWEAFTGQEAKLHDS